VQSLAYGVQSSEARLSLVLDNNGKVVGTTGSDLEHYAVATGSASALADKTYRYLFKSTGSTSSRST